MAKHTSSVGGYVLTKELYQLDIKIAAINDYTTINIEEQENQRYA